MDLYFATTPLNIFNCLAIKMNMRNNIKADIIISNFCALNKTICDKLIKENVFENVYFIDQLSFEQCSEGKNKLSKIFNAVKNKYCNRFGYRKLTRQQLQSIDVKKKYDNCFFDTPNYVQRFVFYNFLKNNVNLKYHRVDCGIESYYEMVLSNKFPSFLRNPQKRLYTFVGNFYLNTNRVDNIKNYEIIKIKQFTREDSNMINFINNLFGYNNVLLPGADKKVIYFDQLLEDVNVAYDLNDQNSVLNSCKEMFGEKFIVKLHPRRVNARYYDAFESYCPQFTYEIELLNSQDIASKILVSPFSSAVFLPKLLFNEEPIIILLINCMDFGTNEKKEVLEFVEMMRNMYTDPSKIHTPSSFEEFKLILEGINETI